MKIISHRGNLEGQDKTKENKPSHIKQVIEKGFEVEIDLWYVDNKFYLGHDMPTYVINNDFFDKNMWIHCKNIGAVEQLKSTKLNWFWHEEDQMTITSLGYIWCFPETYVDKGITVVLGRKKKINKKILGVCTDYPKDWME